MLYTRIEKGYLYIYTRIYMIAWLIDNIPLLRGTFELPRNYT